MCAGLCCESRAYLWLAEERGLDEVDGLARRRALGRDEGELQHRLRATRAQGRSSVAAVHHLVVETVALQLDAQRNDEGEGKLRKVKCRVRVGVKFRAWGYG